MLRPFAGVRVADFAWVIAGPLATQYLAVHGADVIHIESAARPDVLRGGQPMVGGATGPNNAAYFANFNQGKRGITLNLREPRAVDLAKRVISTCDIVAENFTPGTMEKLGLGYQALREVRPDIIMISMSLAGQTGPERSYKGFGTVIQGAAGISDLTGWPDRPPAGTGVAYTDFFASHVSAFLLLSALDYRRRTGKGQYIDLSQQEASMYGLDAALLDQAVNGHQQQRAGNRHPHAAPHGAFPCRATHATGQPPASATEHAPPALPSPLPAPAPAPLPQSALSNPHSADDAWVAIAVQTDAHWRGLRAAMGEPDWAQAERWQTLLGRKAGEDELEARIAAWTSNLDVERAAGLLRACGAPAAVVADARGLHEDPQLLARGHFLNLHHPAQGDFPYDALSYRVNGQLPLPPAAAPCLGQDNAPVFRDLLGLNEDDYRSYEAEAVMK